MVMRTQSGGTAHTASEAVYCAGRGWQSAGGWRGKGVVMFTSSEFHSIRGLYKVMTIRLQGNTGGGGRAGG